MSLNRELTALIYYLNEHINRCNTPGYFHTYSFLIDLYAYQAFKTTFRDSSPFRMGYWIFSGLVWVSLIIAFTTLNRQDGFNPMFMYFMAFMILSLVPKLIVSAFMLIEDVIRLIGGVYNLLRLLVAIPFYRVAESL